MNPQKTGSLIAQLRREQQLTQKDLAQKLGVTAKAVSRWETGKGYPDIETLPALSTVFSVSIGELLDGKKTVTVPCETVSEQHLQFVCEKASDNRRHTKKTILILVSCLAAVSVLSAALLGVLGFLSWQTVWQSVQGSNHAVIAEDYSYITYYGETYLPLDTHGYECRLDKKIVKEASVENLDPFTKLLFGDSIYSLENISESKMIYLQTEYDLCPSQYYVHTSALSEMEKAIAEFAPAALYAEIEQTDGIIRDVLLDDELQVALQTISSTTPDPTLDCYRNTRDDRRIPVVAFDKAMLFYEEVGEILYKNGEYYWFDYLGEPIVDPATSHPYPLSDDFDVTLDTLRQYMP